jgi:hypothetical protein
MEKYGLNANSIIDKVNKVLKRKWFNFITNF